MGNSTALRGTGKRSAPSVEPENLSALLALTNSGRMSLTGGGDGCCGALREACVRKCYENHRGNSTKGWQFLQVEIPDSKSFFKVHAPTYSTKSSLLRDE